jgi:hypothetical protein
VNRVSVNQCAQCRTDIIAPEWSEHLSDYCIRHVWGPAMPAGIGLRIRSTCRVSRRMRHRRAKQLRNVHRNPSRLIFAEQLGRWLPSWLFLEINTSELLPGGVN